MTKLKSDVIVKIRDETFIEREIQVCRYCHFYEEQRYGEFENGEVVRIRNHNTCTLYKDIKKVDPEYAGFMKSRPYTGATYCEITPPEIKIDKWTERDVIIPGRSVSFVKPCKYRFEDKDIKSLILESQQNEEFTPP